jgi:hypothetical protein
LESEFAFSGEHSQIMRSSGIVRLESKKPRFKACLDRS